MAAGIELEFYQVGAAGASGLTISAATAGTIVVKGDDAANSIVFGESTARNIGTSIRFVTDGTKWYSIKQPNVTSAAMATATMSLFQIKT